MPRQHNIFNLTNREIDILNILWTNKEPLVASDIVKKDHTLTINTVQATLRKLLKKKLIEVADIVYSGTVLCRSYRPSMNSEEFALQEFAAQFQILDQNITASNLVATLLEQEEDDAATLKEINKLEILLKEKKEFLKKKEE